MNRFSIFAVLAVSAFAAGGTALADQAQTGNGGYGVVTLAGKLSHSKNVSNFTHNGAGDYTFKFDSDVSKCSSTATIARRGQNSLLPGFIVVGDPRGENDTVTVATFDTVTLLQADFPFDLNVTC